MTKKVSEIAAEWADRESIRDCIYRYCRGIDRVDTDLLYSCYWPEAIDEHGNFATKSAKEFVDHVLPILGSMKQTKHVVTNILIDIQGSLAYVETYVWAYHCMRKADGTLYDHLASGRYIDEMEKRDDEWRIKHRNIVIDWSREFPDSLALDHGAMGDIGYGKDKPFDTGLRKPDDISYRLLKPRK